MVPTVELPPAIWSTDQVMVGFVNPLVVAVNCWVLVASTSTVAGDSDSTPATVIVALALAFATATLVAVMVCVPARAGAVYKPAALMVPTVGFPLAIPSTDHVTAVFENPCTVAVNWSVAAGVSVPTASATDTNPTATAALALFVVSATLVAVTV
jgi:hypothetical protein